MAGCEELQVSKGEGGKVMLIHSPFSIKSIRYVICSKPFSCRLGALCEPLWAAAVLLVHHRFYCVTKTVVTR